MMIKKVVILNIEDVERYISGTPASYFPTPIDSILKDIETQILNNQSYQYCVDCCKNWNKVHVFKHLAYYEGYVAVYYEGTMKL